MKNWIRNSATALAMLAVGMFAAFFTVRTLKEEADTGIECAIEAATLKKGDRGADVKEVQTKLKKWGYYQGSIDGIYGEGTRKAVIYFQQKNGLVADGVCGSATYAALGINNRSTSSASANKYSSSDVYLLAKVIYAEGRGESYTGQVAIGAVVLNRVKSSSFPNTIAGVVYQTNAFTAVSDGQINLTPDATATRAAKDAMSGWDPTYGCIYYYNPAVATSSWIFSRPTVTVIGKHVFAM